MPEQPTPVAGLADQRQDDGSSWDGTALTLADASRDVVILPLELDSNRAAELLTAAAAGSRIFVVVRGQNPSQQITQNGSSQRGVMGLSTLTPREREVLSLIADGLSNKQIAKRLTISMHTAKRYVESILMKLGCQNRAAAAVRSIQERVLPEPDKSESTNGHGDVGTGHTSQHAVRCCAKHATT